MAEQTGAVAGMFSGRSMYVHVAVEIVVIGAVVVYFARQRAALDQRIRELETQVAQLSASVQQTSIQMQQLSASLQTGAAAHAAGRPCPPPVRFFEHPLGFTEMLLNTMVGTPHAPTQAADEPRIQEVKDDDSGAAYVPFDERLDSDSEIAEELAELAESVQK